jgi:hypothetical protein
MRINTLSSSSVIFFTGSGADFQSVSSIPNQSTYATISSIFVYLFPFVVNQARNSAGRKSPTKGVGNDSTQA